MTIAAEQTTDLPSPPSRPRLAVVPSPPGTLFAAALKDLDVTDLVRDSVQQDVMILTPAIAMKLIMDHLAQNRPLDRRAVLRYRGDMEGGAWSFTADPLRFDVSGKLIDGQHRVHAVATLDDRAARMPFAVVRGLPPEAIMAMDQGKKRTASMQLGLRGQKYASAVAASARVVIAWESLRGNGGLIHTSTLDSATVSTPLLEQWVNAHQDEIDEAMEVSAAFRSGNLPVSLAFAAFIILARIDRGAAVDFFTKLSEGGEPKGSPILTLDKKLQRTLREGGGKKPSYYLGLTFRAWNAWRDQRPLTVLRVGADISFPIPK